MTSVRARAAALPPDACSECFRFVDGGGDGRCASCGRSCCGSEQCRRAVATRHRSDSAFCSSCARACAVCLCEDAALRGCVECGRRCCASASCLESFRLVALRPTVWTVGDVRNFARAAGYAGLPDGLDGPGLAAYVGRLAECAQRDGEARAGADALVRRFRDRVAARECARCASSLRQCAASADWRPVEARPATDDPVDSSSASSYHSGYVSDADSSDGSDRGAVTAPVFDSFVCCVDDGRASDGGASDGWDDELARDGGSGRASPPRCRRSACSDDGATGTDVSLLSDDGDVVVSDHCGGCEWLRDGDGADGCCASSHECSGRGADGGFDTPVPSEIFAEFRSTATQGVGVSEVT